MTSSNRRVFLMQVATASGAMALASSAQAQAALSESDPLAAAQGYKADASKVDKAKYPKYAAGQLCSNCALYQGAATAAAAPCALFPGKTVAGKGWCQAYAKKA
jgi:High potential iron-sulfur protein